MAVRTSKPAARHSSTTLGGKTWPSKAGRERLLANRLECSTFERRTAPSGAAADAQIVQRTEIDGATEEATHAYVLLREVGKKKWLYLDGKGGEAATRVRAARYTIKQATEIARDIMTDNPGTWETKVLPIE